MKVVGLYRYPVKSLRGHEVIRAAIEPIGMEGDRRWMVVDRAGKFRTIRELPAMAQIAVGPNQNGVTLSHVEHGSVSVDTPRADASIREVKVWRDTVSARSADALAGAFLSRVLGEDVDLVYFDGPRSRPVDPTFGRPGDHVSFADGYPILVTATGSLDHLNRLLPAPIPMSRFRPNIVVSTPAEWEEDSWKLIRIGTLVLRIVKPCSRCVITTRDQQTGEQPDPREPLRTLGKIHRSARGGIIFGQNAIPDKPGTVSVGDPIEILESGPSNLL